MAASEQRYRQQLRLKSYDYSQHGANFVTIVAQNRACLFGAIQDEAIALSPAGEMLQSIWQTLPTRFPSIMLDASIIMPNHFHGIIVFPVTNPSWEGDTSAVGAPLRKDQR